MIDIIVESNTNNGCNDLHKDDKDEVYENVPGGRYWEPGWDEADDEEFVDYDADNYDDVDLPFDSDSPGYYEEESKEVTEKANIKFNPVSNMTMDDFKKWTKNMWGEDRIVIQDNTGEFRDIGGIFCDEDMGYIYLELA